MIKKSNERWLWRKEPEDRLPLKMKKKRSEPKRLLENIRKSSVEKLEQTIRYDENVTYTSSQEKFLPKELAT